MECRDYKNKITAYLAGTLPPDETVSIENHLSHCPGCQRELASFRELDRLIDAADLSIPVVDLTKNIMREIEAGQEVKAGGRKRMASLVQDVVAAAAAAIIIFWISGPVLAGGSVPGHTSKEVISVSTTVGGIFQSYMDFSASAMDKLSHSIKEIGPGRMKGDDGF